MRWRFAVISYSDAASHAFDEYSMSTTTKSDCFSPVAFLPIHAVFPKVSQSLHGSTRSSRGAVASAAASGLAAPVPEILAACVLFDFAAAATKCSVETAAALKVAEVEAQRRVALGRVLDNRERR